MTRISRDVLSATLSDVVNERLFSIVNRIYDSHKSFHLAIIRAKMIIRQFDYKKNEFELLNNSQFDLKEEKDYFRQDVEKKVEIRNQVLQDEIDVYISDVNENAAIISFVRINIFSNEEHLLIVYRYRKKRNACIRQKISLSRTRNHELEMKREIND
jgi:hypothetical protein